MVRKAEQHQEKVKTKDSSQRCLKSVRDYSTVEESKEGRDGKLKVCIQEQEFYKMISNL